MTEWLIHLRFKLPVVPQKLSGGQVVSWFMYEQLQRLDLGGLSKGKRN